MVRGKSKTVEVGSTTQSFEFSDDNDASADEGIVCTLRDGEWICGSPYKHQIIQQLIDDSNTSADHNDIISKLSEMGIEVYLVMYDSDDMFLDLAHITEAASNHDPTKPDNNRCCLYKDDRGRLFNIVISGGSSGLASTWKSLLVSFSGFEATAAILVLCRSFSCIPSSESSGLRPAYLSLILGLVLTEEISFGWLNSHMFVRGCPSVGAYTLESWFSSDWTRKLIIFVLAVAGAAAGSVNQKYITLFGVGAACCVLAANLGARAWQNLNLRKLKYSGPGASMIAFVMAISTGFAVPYMGFREVEMGGQVALENMLISGLFLAIIFVVSDFDVVQKFILVGSEQCNQDIVNMVIGGWYVVSLFASMVLYKRVSPRKKNDDEFHDEPFLVEDHSSPVKYLVPNLPNFPIDPTMNSKPFIFCTKTLDTLFGVLMALCVGGVIIALGFTDVDDTLFKS